jgi:LEA14-like dessication related protein
MLTSRRATPVWAIPARLIPTWLILALSVWTTACSLFAPKFERPNLSLVSIELVGGNLLRQNLVVRLNIDNPNDRALPVSSVHVELMAGGERVASGVSSQSFVVPSHGATQFDMNITADAAMALVILSQKRERRSGSIDYEMTGGVSIDLPFLRDLPFRQSGTFPLINTQ